MLQLRIISLLFHTPRHIAFLPCVLEFLCYRTLLGQKSRDTFPSLSLSLVVNKIFKPSLKLGINRLFPFFRYFSVVVAAIDRREDFTLGANSRFKLFYNE